MNSQIKRTTATTTTTAILKITTINIQTKDEKKYIHVGHVKGSRLIAYVKCMFFI